MPRATTACNFSSHLSKWLRARRVSEPTCQPCRATNQWKKRCVSRLFYLFTHLHLFFPLTLTFSLLRSSSFFSSLLFSSRAFPTSAFPSVHIIGSLTSRLPSIIIMQAHAPMHNQCPTCVQHSHEMTSSLAIAAVLRDKRKQCPALPELVSAKTWCLPYWTSTTLPLKSEGKKIFFGSCA